MDLITIDITPSEKSRLLSYCEGVHDSGHWGDGAVELPDEKILADRIRSAESVLELSLRDVDILVIHIEDSTDHGFMLLPEDQSLLLKLVETLEQGLRSQVALVERLEETLHSITAIIPEIRFMGISEKESPVDEPAVINESAAVSHTVEATNNSTEDTGDTGHAVKEASPAPREKITAERSPSIIAGLHSSLSRFFSKFTGRGDEAPAINREFGISLDERIRRAKAAAKRINKNR